MEYQEENTRIHMKNIDLEIIDKKLKKEKQKASEIKIRKLFVREKISASKNHLRSGGACGRELPLFLFEKSISRPV